MKAASCQKTWWNSHDIYFFSVFGAIWAKISSFYLCIGSVMHCVIPFSFYWKTNSCSAKPTGFTIFFVCTVETSYMLHNTSLDNWSMAATVRKAGFFTSFLVFNFFLLFLFSDFSLFRLSGFPMHGYTVYFTLYLCSFHIIYELKGFFKLWPYLFSFPLQNLLPILQFITLISSFWMFSLKLQNINGCGLLSDRRAIQATKLHFLNKLQHT